MYKLNFIIKINGYDIGTFQIWLYKFTGRFVYYTLIYYRWKKIMKANTVSQYLYGLTVNSQYLGITVWTEYCPLLPKAMPAYCACQWSP